MVAVLAMSGDCCWLCWGTAGGIGTGAGSQVPVPGPELLLALIGLAIPSSPCPLCPLCLFCPCGCRVPLNCDELKRCFNLLSCRWPNKPIRVLSNPLLVSIIGPIRIWIHYTASLAVVYGLILVVSSNSDFIMWCDDFYIYSSKILRILKLSASYKSRTFVKSARLFKEYRGMRRW